MRVILSGDHAICFFWIRVLYFSQNTIIILWYTTMFCFAQNVSCRLRKSLASKWTNKSTTDRKCGHSFCLHKLDARRHQLQAEPINWCSRKGETQNGKRSCSFQRNKSKLSMIDAFTTVVKNNGYEFSENWCVMVKR